MVVPVEVLIEVMSDGVVELEGLRFQQADRDLKNLVVQVMGLRQIARSQQSPFFVNIVPHQDARHWRIIDVMDACSAAGVDSLTFGKSQE